MNIGGAQTFAQNANALVREWAGTRKQVSLWLDLKITRDYETLEIIERMKHKREFRRSVITGLKIVWELSRGDVTTLLATYPDVVKWLEVKTTPPNSGGGGQLDKIEGLLEIIAATQKQGNGYTLKQDAAPVKSVTPSAPAPVAEVKQAQAASADAICDNFLSMFQ